MLRNVNYHQKPLLSTFYHVSHFLNGNSKIKIRRIYPVTFYMAININVHVEPAKQQDEGDGTLQKSWQQAQRIYAVLPDSTQSM